jgi:dephospho-CoA kinase
MSRRRTRGLPLAVCVTGGIGSGKSHLCRILKRRPGVRREIVARFGRGLLDEHGRLDRERLARRVFTHARELARLERILHPLVRERLARRVRSLKRRGETAIVLVEIPLLVEAGVPDWCDLVVVVEASEDIRFERLTQRGLRPADIRRRMARQASDAERRHIAWIVIANDGDLAALERGTGQLWKRLMTRVGGGE